MIHGNTIDYLEVLTNLLRGEQRQLASSLGLQQVHMQILNYLARSNRYSDSLLVLSDFLGQTKGTVSTSVALLEKKGYIEKVSDPADKRKQHLALTDKGKELIKPQGHIWQLGDNVLNEKERETVDAALDLLLRRLQQANGYQLFGICHSCKHLRQGETGPVCGLTKEALNVSDTDKICVHHDVEN